MSHKQAGGRLERELAGEKFIIGAEVVTTRGYPQHEQAIPSVDLARALLEDERIGWISITDSPGGTPMLPPDWLAGFFPEQRERIVVHLTCKDLNRNALEAYAWRLAAEGIRNILALTGDYPTAGFGGAPQPVFDLDSVGLIYLLSAMNRGLEVPGRGGKKQTLPPTDFYIGCAVSPFKRTERELVPQYFKLVRKIAAGARWVITQLGYDMRKFHEVKLFLEARGIRDVPVVGNVYVLTKGVARLFHQGKLPGCVVSDELWELCNKYGSGPDKGREFFRELAAKQLAVFKGLGFQAGYLGGLAKPEDFFDIIERAERFGENDWRDFLREIRFSLPDEFFFFEHDPETGLSSSDRINPVYLESKKRPARSREVTWSYRLSRWVHRIAFTRNKGLWNLLKRLYARWDKKPGLAAKAMYSLEKTSKFFMYGCRDCGDCSLPDCAYLCPKRWCSKCARNGPCGGSHDGICELDDKPCFWARVYERLKAYGEEEEMLTGEPVLYNAQLMYTSAWANTYLDRDHHAPKDDSADTEGKSSPPNGG